MANCHCGHDFWEHFLDENWDGDVVTGRCHEDECNCEDFHAPENCELSTHERIKE